MEKNPCLQCDCYDADFGCTMPSIDKWYACPLTAEDGGPLVIEFFIPMIPPTTTHQQKQVTVRNGKPVFYEPPELKDARAKFTAHLAQHKIERPITRPVRITTKWLYLIPDSRKGYTRDGEYKTTKPDTDNMIKLLKDCMTKLGFWKDDAQVASEITEKFWAEKPGLYVRIEEL